MNSDMVICGVGNGDAGLGAGLGFACVLYSHLDFVTALVGINSLLISIIFPVAFYYKLFKAELSPREKVGHACVGLLCVLVAVVVSALGSAKKTPSCTPIRPRLGRVCASPRSNTSPRRLLHHPWAGCAPGGSAAHLDGCAAQLAARAESRRVAPPVLGDELRRAADVRGVCVVLYVRTCCGRGACRELCDDSDSSRASVSELARSNLASALSRCCQIDARFDP